MTYLALDIGARRIGVAVGSTDVKFATPLAVIAHETVAADAARIRTLAEQYDAERVVVGLPRELDGGIGPQAQKVIAFAERLAPFVNLPFEYFDERYSTAQALDRQRAMGVNDKRGRATIDAAAAAVILQDFLDSLSW